MLLNTFWSICFLLIWSEIVWKCNGSFQQQQQQQVDVSRIFYSALFCNTMVFLLLLLSQFISLDEGLQLLRHHRMRHDLLCALGKLQCICLVPRVNGHERQVATGHVFDVGNRIDDHASEVSAATRHNNNHLIICEFHDQVWFELFQCIVDLLDCLSF